MNHANSANEHTFRPTSLHNFRKQNDILDSFSSTKYHNSNLHSRYNIPSAKCQQQN